MAFRTPMFIDEQRRGTRSKYAKPDGQADRRHLLLRPLLPPERQTVESSAKHFREPLGHTSARRVTPSAFKTCLSVEKYLVNSR